MTADPPGRPDADAGRGRAEDGERLRRWRMLLGGESDLDPDGGLSKDDAAMDGALAALYDDPGGDGGGSRSAGLGGSAPRVARWLGDIRTYFLSLKPPKYPFPVDQARADRGREVFTKSCVKCHGTYGGDKPEYPNRIVALDEIKTDPARALGIAPRFVAHYNATWFGEGSPVDLTMNGYQAPPLDGIWATAPYLHNGSIPTLATLLQSSERPSRFYRPPSTDFENYDQSNVGWKFDRLTEPLDSSVPIERSHSLFDSTRFGLGNGGHTYGDALSDEARRDVIEYLKTI